MNLKRLVRYFFSLSLLLTLSQCANVGNPTGGEVDVDPPLVMESKPEAGELGVNTREIRIRFNEIVVLNSLNDHFLVSPPTEKKPTVKAYGKDVYVEFEDTLQSNAVYTLYFGDAIVDNNEGNPIKDYTFSFATGYELDTMRLQGYVTDAQTLSPEEGIIVGIYTDFSDSAFTSSVPVRIAKTDKRGYFSINNVKPGVYKVRALSEMDNDFRFNQPGEKIAFLDTKYETTQETITLIDSVFLDSIGEDKEHYPIFQELRPRDSVVYYPDDILLFAFTEERIFQALKGKERKQEDRLDFEFASHIDEEPRIKLLNDQERNDWYIAEMGEDSTTFYYWVKDTALIAQDTIMVLFDYQKTDSLSHLVWQTDTLPMRFKRKKKSARQQRREDKKDNEQEPKAQPLVLDITAKSSVNYFDDVYITSPQPLEYIKGEDFRLYEVVNDSTTKPLDFKFFKDEKKARTYRIEYYWNQEKTYQLAVDSAKIYDIYGQTNDSIGYQFSIVPEDKFSTIFINLKNLKGRAVVQLINASQEVLEEQAVKDDQEIGFYYLKPGKYYFSLFYDINGNGKWDAGKYAEKRQPEEVRFFPKMIETKAYYEMEEDWDVEALPILEQKPDDLNNKK